jgi:hypothetical protein
MAASKIEVTLADHHRFLEDLAWKFRGMIEDLRYILKELGVRHRP